MNIFVAKLDYSLQESDLQELFQGFGEVKSVKIIKDNFDGRSKGYGFVEMPQDEEALAAIEDLNGTEIEGREIVVKKAKPRENNRGSGGYNRGGGGGYNNNRGGGYNNNRGGGYNNDRGGY